MKKYSTSLIGISIITEMQVTMRYHLIPTHLKKNLEKERKKRTSKGVEKLEPLYMGLVEMLNGVTTMENSKEFPQKIKNIITI